jgi:hypothetical protein
LVSIWNKGSFFEFFWQLDKKQKKQVQKIQRDVFGKNRPKSSHYEEKKSKFTIVRG